MLAAPIAKVASSSFFSGVGHPFSKGSCSFLSGVGCLFSKGSSSFFSSAGHPFSKKVASIFWIGVAEERDILQEPELNLLILSDSIEKH